MAHYDGRVRLSRKCRHGRAGKMLAQVTQGTVSFSYVRQSHWQLSLRETCMREKDPMKAASMSVSMQHL